MPERFQQRRHRDDWIGGFGITLIFAGFFGSVPFFNPTVSQVGCWVLYSILLLLSLAYLLAAIYAKPWTLILDDDHIEVRSAFRKRRFATEDIESLSWHFGPTILRGSFGKIIFQRRYFEPADYYRLIRRLRDLVPKDRQVGWPRFCMRYALPLRSRLLPPSVALAEPSIYPPGVEHVVTRDQYDRLILFMLLPTLGVVPLVWWITRQPSVFAGLLTPFLFLPLRFSIRKEGERQLSATVPLGKLAPFVLLTLLALLLLAMTRDWPLPIFHAIAIGFIGVLMGVYVHGTWRHEAMLERLTPLAEQRWEELHSEPEARGTGGT